MARTRWSITAIGLAILLAACDAVTHADENPVMDAYHMRMDGKVDDAKKILELELGKEPTNAALWLELARLEFQRFGKSMELDSAERAIEKAASLSPENPRYYRWAARIAIYNGILKSKNKPEMIEKFKKAATAGEKAVALDPDDHEARRLLVSLYGNNPPEFGGDNELAEKHVKALEARSPVDGAAARCELSFKNQPQKKLIHWSDLAKKLDNNPILHENIAIQNAWVGDVEQATVHAQRALALEPNRCHVLIGLAHAFALQKNTEPAEKFAQAYLDFAPPAPLALRAWTQMALGRIQDMKGNKLASRESLKKAQELDPYCWFTMTPPPEQLFEAP